MISPLAVATAGLLPRSAIAVATAGLLSLGGQPPVPPRPTPVLVWSLPQRDPQQIQRNNAIARMTCECFIAAIGG